MAGLYNTMTDIQYQNYAKIARLNKFQSGVCFDFESSTKYELYFFVGRLVDLLQFCLRFLSAKG